MANLAILKTLLENDARYDTVVRTGNNGKCLLLLRGAKSGAAKVWDDIPIAEFLDALGDFVLSDVAEMRLRTLADNGGVVPTSRAGVRAWLQANITDTSILTALKNLAERKQTWAEDAGVGKPYIDDVRAVVRTISKSFIVSTGQA